MISDPEDSYGANADCYVCLILNLLVLFECYTIANKIATVKIQQPNNNIPAIAG